MVELADALDLGSSGYCRYKYGSRAIFVFALFAKYSNILENITILC